MNEIDIKILQHSFAELQIQNVVRRTERMALPDEHLVVAFSILAKDVMTHMHASYESHKRDVISFFGVPVIVIAKMWELLMSNNINNRKLKKEHLLWALHCMKQAPNITVLCKSMKQDGKKCPTKKTALKWIWFHANEIRHLQEKVILWEHRKTNDRGDDCLMSVDAVDCCFQQTLVDNPGKPGKKMMSKALHSWKISGPALRCEVGVSLLSGDTVWISGPFCPGDWNDLEMLRRDLIHMLEPGERVEADNVCVAEAPVFVVCPKSTTATEEALKMMERVEGRHEALSKHIKNWGCMHGPFVVKGTAMEKMEKHGSLFRACATVKQVAMQMGVGELYEI